MSLARLFLFPAALAALLSAHALAAATYHPQSGTEFNQMSAQLQPGDEIVLPAGTLANWGEMRVWLSGTAEQPITVRGPSTFATTLSGTSRFFITGHHVTVRGLKFIDTSSGYPVHSRNANHLRITQCHFSGTFATSFLRLQYGIRNRVDHSFFTKPYINAVTMMSPESLDYIGGHVIAYNIFRDAPRVPRDGEALALWSDGKHLGYELRALVAYNVFDNWDADNDSEIVTIKSGGNTFFRNVFAWCQGYFSLRRENNNRVDSNLFYRNTEGIRVFGHDHVIVNNIIDSVDNFGLHITGGWESGGIEAIAPERCLIAHNTFRNVGGRNWAFYTASSPNTPPVDNIVVNNIVESDKAGAEAIRDQISFLRNNTVSHNLFFLPNGSQNNISSNPIYASAGLTGDGPTLQLTAGSAASGAGMELDGDPAYDFFGLLREGPRDLGHHAFGGPPSDDPMFAQALPPVPVNRAETRLLPLAAEFFIYPAEQALGEPVNLDAAPTRGQPVHFRWECDGELIYEGAEHFFPYVSPRPGTRSVTLTVTDAEGGASSVTRAFTVTVDARNSPWAQLPAVNGWRHTPIGWLHDAAFPHVYHREHGWLYVVSNYDGTHHAYSHSSGLGWLHLPEAHYPDAVFARRAGLWLHYAPGSGLGGAGRWFFDYTGTLGQDGWFHPEDWQGPAGRPDAGRI